MIRELVRSALERATTPDPRWFDGAPGEEAHGVEITYLGTAGFVVSGHGRTIALDPYVTRADLRRLLAGALVPDDALARRIVPRADDVLVGHAHFDHVLDAPGICLRTGARLVGSRAVCMVGRAAGLPEALLRETSGREDIESGAFTIRGIPSLHGKALFGRVPLPGDIDAPPAWPPRVTALRHGLVLNWRLEVGTFSMVHIDSAEVRPRELEGLRADVVCLCAAGWTHRPRYIEDVVGILRPKVVVPCHWDTMITPIDAPPRLLPGVDLPGMMRAIARAGADPVLLPILGSRRF